MKRWVRIVGFYGLMVCSAQAGKRWSANVCSDIARLWTILEGIEQAPTDRAKERYGLLLLQDTHCGVSTRALQDADLAIVSRGDAPVRAPSPRVPILCDTTSKAPGGSTTDCF
jgi:hypothetical protein